jgi:hypothetical protein
MVFHTTSSRKWYSAAIALVAFALCLLSPAIGQPQSFHLFAGPGTWNVWSNAPFAVIGAWGLYSRQIQGPGAKVAAAGVFLTAFGSAYYHAAPSDARLVWDRLPMTLVFTPLLWAILAVWIGLSVRWLGLFVALGIGSVMWWSATGDIGPYFVLQGTVFLMVASTLRDARIHPLWRPGLAYVAAFLLERFDRHLFDATDIPGHPLKHLFAALAAYWVVQWISSSYATESQSNALPPDGIATAP